MPRKNHPRRDKRRVTIPRQPAPIIPLPQAEHLEDKAAAYRAQAAAVASQTSR
jgi:hypothetical protein